MILMGSELTARDLIQPRASADSKPSIAVVCCVESGPLETTTVMMIESLRCWGGRFADIPVVAVTPRLGPPLRRWTRRRFDELNVTYVRRRLTRKYSWYSFLNKPLSLNIAEEMINAELVMWLDADVLVTGEPSPLALAPRIDFGACPSDRNLGSTAPSDAFEPYWVKMCQVFGLSVDDLPWVYTCRERERIRFYFNGGVLVYRRSTGYGPAYLRGCLKVLDANICSREASLFFAEQATVGLVAVKKGLSWVALPEECNYAVGSKAGTGFDPVAFVRAKLLHYHDALWPHFFPQFLEMCQHGQPALYEWLKNRSPLVNEAPLAWRVIAKGIKAFRAKQERTFEASCTKL